MSPASQSPFAAAVLLAAGRSTRMAGAGGPLVGGGLKKPFLEIGGRTVLEIACEAFFSARHVREIVIVGPEEDLQRMRELVAGLPFAPRISAWVQGGEERTDSVRQGVAAIDAASTVVLVHDVARPFVEPAAIDAVAEAAVETGAALLAVPVRDTIKASSQGTHSDSTLNRAILWAAQTPQGFATGAFRDVLAQAAADEYRPTDDAALYERYVGPVALVEGSTTNIKLTIPEDLVLAEAILGARERAREKEKP